jgi:GDPmannose 4,6-dehydratase
MNQNIKKALICGVLGQDGAYLCKLLLQKKYEVWGTSRDAAMGNYLNFNKIGIDRSSVNLVSMAQNDFKSVLGAIQLSNPGEIYFLSGQSSVGLSFEQPAETIDSLVLGLLNILEAVRIFNPDIRVYNASSGECFGEIDGGLFADESTPFRPKSPYGVAKASSHMLSVNYRESYGLFCSNGILFNHESPLRPERFVTRKIINTACKIYLGKSHELSLGQMHISRDWGYAPEYVEAMWLSLQADVPDDYVIATGKSYSLQNFVEKVFGVLDLDWKNHVNSDTGLFRPSDINHNSANPFKAERILGWKARIGFDELIELLVSNELEESRAKYGIIYKP